MPLSYRSSVKGTGILRFAQNDNSLFCFRDARLRFAQRTADSSGLKPLGMTILKFFILQRGTMGRARSGEQECSPYTVNPRGGLLSFQQVYRLPHIVDAEVLR